MKNQYLQILGVCLAVAGTAHAQKKIPNYAVANLVLGQDDFVSNGVLSPASAFSMSDPSAVIIDPVSRKVFVADEGNGRVLRYPNVQSLYNGAFAEAVFGKPNFSTSGASAGQDGMSTQLRGLFLDRRGRLWVVDRNNNRVVCFESAVYRSSAPFADKVIGQPDFATTSSGLSASKMNWPQGVCVDSADRLWVADYSNNRVLRFDSITTKSNGASADGVLGQPNFVSNSGGVGIAKTGGPVGLAVTSSGTLFVGEYDNNRVIRFNNAATLANGANASAVLGQPDFALNGAGTTATTMNTTGGLAWSPNDDLWVMDSANNRALRFEKASTLPSGSAASGVVGQPNFTTSTFNLTNRGLHNPYYFLALDATGSLWIPDSSNNRILRFPPDVTAPVLTITSTVPKTTTKKSIVIKGTASDAYGVAKVLYKVNSGSVKTATGTTSWQFTASLVKGTSTITINAYDSVGNATSKVLKIKRTTTTAAPQLLVSDN